MGNWTVIVEGTGPHHNDEDFDADFLAEEFVKKAKDKGHMIDHATITSSGRHTVIPSEKTE